MKYKYTLCPGYFKSVSHFLFISWWLVCVCVCVCEFKRDTHMQKWMINLHSATHENWLRITFTDLDTQGKTCSCLLAFHHPVAVLEGSGSVGKMQGALTVMDQGLLFLVQYLNRIKYRGKNPITYLYHIRSFIFTWIILHFMLRTCLYLIF